MLAAGAVYIYERNKSGNWELFQTLVPQKHLDPVEKFGFSVSISGNRLIVGAPGESYDYKEKDLRVQAGAAYMYNFDEKNKWQLQQKITPKDRSTGDFFGHDVSISGSTAVIGAPRENDEPGLTSFENWRGAAYVFEENEFGTMD